MELSKEEKEAMDFYKSIIDEWHTHYDNCGFEEKSIKRLETLLNLISKLQKENEKQGKVIDMMSLSISSLDGQLEINQYKDMNDVKHKFFEYLEDGTYEGLKQYFYRKVGEGK